MQCSTLAFINIDRLNLCVSQGQWHKPYLTLDSNRTTENTLRHHVCVLRRTNKNPLVTNLLMEEVSWYMSSGNVY